MVPLRTNRLEPCNPRQTGRRQALLRLCSIAIGGHGRRWAWRGFSQVLATPHLPNFFCRMTALSLGESTEPVAWLGPSTLGWPGWDAQLVRALARSTNSRSTRPLLLHYFHLFFFSSRSPSSLPSSPPRNTQGTFLRVAVISSLSLFCIVTSNRFPVQDSRLRFQAHRSAG